MDNLFRYAGGAACVVVLMACVCRIDLMRGKRTRPIWFLMYALFAMYALGTVLGIWRGGSFDWNDAAGIGAILVNVFATRHLWKDGQPPETVKGALE